MSTRAHGSHSNKRTFIRRRNNRPTQREIVYDFYYVLLFRFETFQVDVMRARRSGTNCKFVENAVS